MNVKNIGVVGGVTKQPLKLYNYDNINTLLYMFLHRPYVGLSKKYIEGHTFNMKL